MNTYFPNVLQAADRVEEDHLVFQLQPSSPRLRAELQEADQHAALNRQLAQQIPNVGTWQQLGQFLQQHGPSLNFLNVVALVLQAAAVAHQQVSGRAGLGLWVGMLSDPSVKQARSVNMFDWMHGGEAMQPLPALGAAPPHLSE